MKLMKFNNSKFYKLILAIKLLLLNPRVAFVMLYEKNYQLHGAKHGFFNTISLDQIYNGKFPQIKYVSFLGGGSGPTDYLLLLLLAKKYDSLNYLEIGSWRGESIRNILELDNCKRAVSLTLDSFKYYYVNKSIYESSNVFLNYDDHRLKQVYADSTNFDFSALGKFDLVFIDGDHSYDAILSDTKNALNLLRDDSSVIVWHDYSYDNDHSVRNTTLNAIKDSIPNNYHKYLYYVENTMSAIYSKQKFNSSQPKEIGNHTIPSKYFSLNIEVKRIDEFPITGKN
jgi:hypothetical protein